MLGNNFVTVILPVVTENIELSCMHSDIFKRGNP